MRELRLHYEELKDKCCLDNGCKVEVPGCCSNIFCGKFRQSSDVDVYAHSRYDMSFKWFLVLAPESDVIDPSSLFKFLKQRLGDESLLDKLIGKILKIAVDNGLIKKKEIIMDSTHSEFRANA